MTPGVPAFLHPLPADTQARSRLTFARWLVDRHSPTTARAIVNRVWQTYFGTGLVATQRGSSAAERNAVASRTARLAGGRIHGARLEPEGTASTDRDSRDLSPIVARDAGSCWRRTRTTACSRAARASASRPRSCATSPCPRAACSIRESRRPQRLPAGAGVPVPAAGQLRPEGLARRTRDRTAIAAALYTFRYRSVPYPMLQTFDAPNGDAACVRRSRSNTPLQALTTLNEPSSWNAPGARPEDRHRRRQNRRGAADLRVPPLPVPATRRPRKPRNC